MKVIPSITLSAVLLTPLTGLAQDQQIDFEAPPEASNLLTPSLSYGGQLSMEYELEDNFDLDNSEDEDLGSLKPSVELAFSYQPNERFRAFLNLDLAREFIVQDENRDRDNQTTLDVDKAYIEFSDLLEIDDVLEDVTLTLGRQRIKDSREWLYDETVDGALLSFELDAIDTEFELSINRKELIGTDLLHHDDIDRINNYIFYAEHEPIKDIELAAYAIFRDDRSADQERPLFFGLRSSGELLDERFEYWADFALARGKDDQKKISGYGFDLGATYALDTLYCPYFTLGYAYGSGDGDSDTDFRQTGLHGNADKFGGVAKLKYYGELFDPELSNLSVFTAAIGFRPSRESSVDLVYHHYRQNKAADELRDSSIDPDPDGEHKALGYELDLIVGYREIADVKAELTLGYFNPGRAFDAEASDAYFANFELSYDF